MYLSSVTCRIFPELYSLDWRQTHSILPGDSVLGGVTVLKTHSYRPTELLHPPSHMECCAPSHLCLGKGIFFSWGGCVSFHIVPVMPHNPSLFGTLLLLSPYCWKQKARAFFYAFVSFPSLPFSLSPFLLPTFSVSFPFVLSPPLPFLLYLFLPSLLPLCSLHILLIPWLFPSLILYPLPSPPILSIFCLSPPSLSSLSFSSLFP